MLFYPEIFQCVFPKNMDSLLYNQYKRQNQEISTDSILLPIYIDLTPISPSNVLYGKRKKINKKGPRGFPGGAVVKNLPANAGDTGSSPGLGGSHMPRSN